MNRIFFILPFMIILLACNNDAGSKDDVKDTAAVTKEPPAVDTMKVAGGHNASNSLDWAGTYKGVLPCADCEGIETEIMLHGDSTFMLSEKYLGKKDATIHKSEGKWKWIDGSNIELDGMKNRPARYFVAENRIIQLDREGKRIEGALAEKYILTKIK